MFLLPPVGGGETFEIKKVYLIGTKNKFQFRSYFVSYTYISLVTSVNRVTYYTDEQDLVPIHPSLPNRHW